MPLFPAPQLGGVVIALLFASATASGDAATTAGGAGPATSGPTSSAAILGAHPFENVVWNGRPHRNFCIRMTGGEAIVRLLAGDAPSDDPNGFEVYANEKYDTTSRPILDGRAIEIRTPSFPTYTGEICLGVALRKQSAESSR